MGRHRAVNIICPQLPVGSLACGHPVDHFWQGSAEFFGILAKPVEGDDPAQVVAAHRFGAHRFGEADLSSHRACVPYFLAVNGYEPTLFGPVAVGGVINADDSDLVVGEQVTLNRLTKSQLVEHLSKLLLVIH